MTGGLSDIFEGMGEELAEWTVAAPGGQRMVLQLASPASRHDPNRAGPAHERAERPPPGRPPPRTWGYRDARLEHPRGRAGAEYPRRRRRCIITTHAG